MMIRTLLQVSPLARPTCDRILGMKNVQANLSDTLKEKLDIDGEEEASPRKRRLLNTIRVPKDMVLISDRLPKPQYHLTTER